jgi:hypothetical protein
MARKLCVLNYDRFAFVHADSSVLGSALGSWQCEARQKRCDHPLPTGDRGRGVICFKTPVPFPHETGGDSYSMRVSPPLCVRSQCDVQERAHSLPHEWPSFLASGVTLR